MAVELKISARTRMEFTTQYNSRTGRKAHARTEALFPTSYKDEARAVI